MMNYQAKYKDYLKKAQVSLQDLSLSLRDNIVEFEETLALCENANAKQQAEYLPIIIKVDSILSAWIYNQFKDKFTNNTETKVDAEKEKRLRLMRLKAKALQIKLDETN